MLDVMSTSAVPTWSPDLNSETRIYRRFAQIPKQQQRLLDDEDAWTASARNVPDDILRELRDAKAASQAQKKPPSAPPPQQTPGCPATPSQSQSQHVERSRKPPAKEQDSTTYDSQQFAAHESEDDEKPISNWSQSPDEHLRPRVALEKEALEELELPRTSPHFRVLTPRPKAVLPFNCVDAPLSASSQASSQLQIEAPQAITDVPNGPKAPGMLDAWKPVRNPAMVAASVALVPLEPTPPSAQIIPCTYSTQGSPMKGQETKRQRLMKNPADRFASPEPYKPTTSHPVLTSTLPSSLVLSSPFKEPQLSASADTRIDSQLTASTKSPSQTWKAKVVETHRNPMTDLNLVQLNSTVDKPPPNGPTSQVPFTAFLVAYPHIECSLHSFIRALICVKNLQGRRALPEFLYDDFIRVFCGDYLDYIRGRPTEDPDTKTLSAIQWYNENVTSPVCTKRVITRTNLDSVLETHSDKLRVVEEEMGIKPVRRSLPRPEPQQRVPNTPALCPKASSPPRVSTVDILGPIVHAGELASDPIEVDRSTQSAMKHRHSLPVTSNSFLSNLKRVRSSSRTPQPESEKRARVDMPSPMQTQLAPPTSIIDQAVRYEPAPAFAYTREPKLRNGVSRTSIGFLPDSGAVIPDTTAKPKPSARVSYGSTAGKPKSRKKTWEEYLEARLSSTAPEGPAAR